MKKTNKKRDKYSDFKESLKNDWYCVIENVLTKSEIDLFLNGNIKYLVNVSKTRSIKKIWNGVNSWVTTKNITKLEDNRIDILLDIQLSNYISGIYDIKNVLPDKVSLQAIHILYNPPGSKMQEYHQDGSYEEYDDYFMILIPLNYSEGMGMTEISLRNDSIIDKTIKPFVGPGSALIMSGCKFHRGTPNLSSDYRYCLYLVYSTKKYDYDPFFGN